MKSIKKIGILLPAYRRPIETRNAIFSALNQNYGNCKVFVALKGYSEDYANILFINEFFDFIEKGDLVIKVCSNKCQISNTLDCVRDEDVSDIDYYVKMDNDDVYLRNYVSNCVDFLNAEYEAGNYPDGVGSHFAYDIEANNNLTWFVERWRNQVYGNQLAFSPKVMEILFEVEQGDFKSLDKLGINKDDYKNLMDDNLVRDIARALGGFLEKTMYNDCFYNNTSASCYRDASKFLGTKRKDNNLLLKEALKMNEQEVLHVYHAYWEDYFTILGNRFSKNDGDSGTIISHENGVLIVEWDNWGKEIFKKHKEGFYLYAGDISIEC